MKIEARLASEIEQHYSSEEREALCGMVQMQLRFRQLLGGGLPARGERIGDNNEWVVSHVAWTIHDPQDPRQVEVAIYIEPV